MADLLRVSILGDMPSGEEWTTNPVFSIGGDFGAPVSSTQASTIAIAIAAVVVPTGVTNMMSPGVNVKGVRVEARSLAGVLESQGEALRGTPANGTGGGVLPFQSAAVTSLRTGHAGATGRGRLYWPATGVTTATATLRIPTANVTSYLAGVKTYLSNIQAAIDVTLDGVSLAVWSRKNLDLYPVTSLQLGDVVDTQRRRRDQLIETYQSLTYP